MEFSIRDKQTATALLKNQRGQAIVEYVLVLVVTVSLILGGLYQLNTAFKSWANNYFGNYIACLLESGELPNISGGGGDGGICNEIFKPFSLADGRPLNPGYKPPEGTAGTGGGGGGSREKPRAGTTVGGGGGRGGGGGGGGGGGSFSNSFGKGSRKSRSGGGGKKGASATYTGSMASSDYGSGAGGGSRKLNVGVRRRLDNRFAFEDERERPQKRTVAGTMKRPQDESTKAPRTRVKRTEAVKAKTGDPDSGLTLPNFLKWIIIAGILIALIVFLGGQGLQIGKSMD